MAKNYNPQNSLITLEFGLNDFMNYDREVADVKADLSSAMIRLTESGANNILLFTLPDATKAPQFKYSTQDEIDTVRAKIVEFNEFIKEQATLYQTKGLNVVLYDAHDIFDQITSNPKQHGFENSTDACLNINRSSQSTTSTAMSLLMTVLTTVRTSMFSGGLPTLQLLLISTLQTKSFRQS